MNNRQENKNSMYYVVVDICNAHKKIWLTIPAFAESFDEFHSVFKEIQTVDEIKLTNTTGIAKNKKAAKYKLIDEVFKLIGSLTAYASMEKNHELKQMVNYNIWTLQRMRDTELESICRGILDTGTDVITALADYGTTESDLEVLQNKISEYDRLISAPRDAITHKAMATTMLKELFAKADHILKEQMDQLMVLFKDQNRDFYMLYFNSRKIVDRGVRHRKAV